MVSDVGQELRNMFMHEDAESELIDALKMLLEKDKNLPLKTEIPDPLSFSVLGSVSDYLKSKKMFKTAKTIKVIQDNYMLFMVSKNRKGREEAIKVLQGYVEKQDLSAMERLFARDGGKK